MANYVPKCVLDTKSWKFEETVQNKVCFAVNCGVFKLYENNVCPKSENSKIQYFLRGQKKVRRTKEKC